MEYAGIGLFFDEASIEEIKKRRDALNFKWMVKRVDKPYVKLDAKVDEIDEKIIGKKVTVLVMGYGRSDKNEGFRVSLYSTGDEKLDTIIRESEKPYIALAMEHGAREKDTKELQFRSIMPFSLRAKFGVIDRKGKVTV